MRKRRRLSPVIQNKRPILFVRNRPLFIWGMRLAKIHQLQRMICIPDRPAELLQLQPANTTMIKLHELAIDFHTNIITQLKFFLSLARALLQKVKVSFLTVKLGSIRTPVSL